MTSALIAAMDRRGLIGADGVLPWHLPADLRRFRALTMGKPLILGRRTFESIGRPLPGRHTIILTHDPDYRSEGCRIAHDLASAEIQAEEILTLTGGQEWFVAGGGEVYRQALDRVDRLYLTLVEGLFRGNVVFPLDLVHLQEWQVTSGEYFAADQRNPHGHAFVILTRQGQEEVGTIAESALQLVNTVLKY
jgi:dihydrofolate reductase